MLYADTISAAGAITNVKQRYVTAVNGTAFSEGAILVTNQSKDYNYSLTGQLKKRFSSGLEANFAYTYNRAYDIQSVHVRPRHLQLAKWPRVLGAGDDSTLTTSLFERRHRVLAYGTYTMPW